MLVLVGAPASGKTTWRRRLVADGYPAERVVSLDELRREVAARVEAAGGPVRSPEEWTTHALRLAARLRAHLVADGTGYLADATHLRRSERAVHRYDPAGRLVATVPLPASQVTSCCLADGRLFVTTASKAMTDPEPDAGRLFVAEVGVSAPPVAPYRGTTSKPS